MTETDKAAEAYRQQNEWPTKAQWIERKGILNSPLSYEVGDYVEEAFLAGAAYERERAKGKIEALKTDLEIAVEALDKMTDWPTYADMTSKHPMGSVEQREDCIAWFIQTARETLSTLKSKLGRGEK